MVNTESHLRTEAYTMKRLGGARVDILPLSYLPRNNSDFYRDFDSMCNISWHVILNFTVSWLVSTDPFLRSLNPLYLYLTSTNKRKVVSGLNCLCFTETTVLFVSPIYVNFQ